jgi:thioredoxin 1
MQELQQQEEDGPATGSEGDSPSEPVHVHGADELGDVTASNKVVLADFYADWCGPCKMIAPIVEELAAETEAAVAKVDVDANQQLAAQYGVQGVPTLLLFVDGEPEERIVGAQSKDALADLITQHTQ